MAMRPSKFSQAEIVKLMEAAGWNSRYNGNHAILSKEGHRNFTITDPVNRNGIAEIQRELGVHISNLIVKPRGGASLPRAEIVKRMQLAKQLRTAGFSTVAIDKMVKLTSFYVYGFAVNMLDYMSAEEIAAKMVRGRQTNKGIKIKSEIAPGRLIATPLKQIVTEAEKQTESSTDLDTLLAMMAGNERRLEMLTRTDRISLFGTYLNKLQETFVDAKALQTHLQRANEAINRIVERLEQGDGA